MNSPLEQLAYAGLEIEDLAKGVSGTVSISIEMADSKEEQAEKLQEILDGQRLLIANGWKRMPDHERGVFKDRPEIEYRVYRKRFENGAVRWASVTLVRFFGIGAVFLVGDRRP